MKKIIILSLAILTLCTSVVYAKSDNEIKRTETVSTSKAQTYKINFNDTEFILKKSTNKTPSGEYVNEYYKENETPDNWTEMISVSELPKYQSSTMDYAEMILSVDHSPNNYDRPVTMNSKTDKVTFVYLLRGKQGDVRHIDFNAMQVLPYKNRKGIKCVQYSRKHLYTNREEYLSGFNAIETDKTKYFNLVKDMEMPELIKKDIN